MRFNLPRALVMLAVSLCLLPSLAFGGAITDGSVTGPGGSGNPNIFLNVAESQLFYTSVDYLDLTLTVNSAGYYDLTEAPSLGSVSNFTGTPWSAFKVEILSSDVGVVFTALQFAPPGYPLAYDYGGVLPIVNWSTTSIEFSGGVVNSPGALAPVMAFQTDGPGTIVFRQTPVAVPEPTTLVQLVVGGMFLSASYLYRRRS